MLQLLTAALFIVAGMLLWFSGRTYTTAYRLKEGDVVTKEMYETLFTATSALAFTVLPALALLLIVFSFMLWKSQCRLRPVDSSGQ